MSKLDELIKIAKKFKNVQSFVNSFYVDNWADKLAFGYKNGKQWVNPKKIKIKWVTDWKLAKPFENANVKRFPAIEVVYENDDLYLEDGHHRLKTALKQKELIKIDLRIKQSPLSKLNLENEKELREVWFLANMG